MRTIHTNVYQFSELSDEAKETARDWYRHGNDLEYSEYIDSMEKFAYFFGVNLGRWTLSPNACETYIPFTSPGLTTDGYDENEDEIVLSVGETLRGFIPPTVEGKPGFLEGHCPLTGVCFDETLLDAIRANLDNPSKEQSDLAEVFSDAFHALAKAINADYEYAQSDEAVDESIEANEYEFLEDGSKA